VVERESLTAEELTAELSAHGLHFVIGAVPAPWASQLSPAQLLENLAKQRDARLRVALVALFLYRPEIAEVVPEALSKLDSAGQTTLKLYYTAATILQSAYARRLKMLSPRWSALPDLFSQEMGIPKQGNWQMRLQQLGNRHRQLTGVAANWAGTYEYAASRLLRRLERESLWAA